LAEHPDDSFAQTRLAAVYERLGDVDKASGAYAAALKVNPSNLGAATSMVRIHLARGDTGKALELAKATRKLAPDDPDVAHALGRLAMTAGDRSWGLSLLQESARKKPDSPEILFDLAEGAYESGLVAVSETALKDALKADPNFSRAPKARELLEMMELAANPAKATALVAKVELRLKADPSDLPGLMAMAAIQEAKLDVAGAVKSYEKALVRNPDFAPAMRGLTIIASKNDSSDQKVLDRGAKAREAFPSDAELAKAFGIIVYKQGNYSRAQGLLQDSSRALASDPEVFFYLGMAQYSLKDRAGSMRALQRAQELGLKGKMAEEAKKILASPAKS